MRYNYVSLDKKVNVVNHIHVFNWNFKPNDLSGMFAKYDPRQCNLEDTQVTQAS